MWRGSWICKTTFWCSRGNTNSCTAEMFKNIFCIWTVQSKMLRKDWRLSSRNLRKLGVRYQLSSAPTHFSDYFVIKYSSFKWIIFQARKERNTRHCSGGWLWFSREPQIRHVSLMRLVIYGMAGESIRFCSWFKIIRRRHQWRQWLTKIGRGSWQSWRNYRRI